MTDRNAVVQLDLAKLLGFKRFAQTGRDQAALGATFNKVGAEVPPAISPEAFGATFNKAGAEVPPGGTE